MIELEQSPSLISTQRSLVLRQRITPEALERSDHPDNIARLINPLKYIGLVAPSNEAELAKRLDEESALLLALGIPGDLYVQLAVRKWGKTAMDFCELFGNVDPNRLGISYASPAVSMDGDANLDPLYPEGWAAHLRLATHQADGSDLYYTGHRFDEHTDGFDEPCDVTQQVLLDADRSDFELGQPGYNMSEVNAAGHCVRYIAKCLERRRNEPSSRGAARVLSPGRKTAILPGIFVFKGQKEEVVTYVRRSGGFMWIGHDDGRARKKVGVCRSIGRNGSEF